MEATHRIEILDQLLAVSRLEFFLQRFDRIICQLLCFVLLHDCSPNRGKLHPAFAANR